MRSKIVAAASALALSTTIGLGVAAPSAFAAPPPSVTAERTLATATSIPISASDGVESFTGTFTPTGFTTVDGVLSVTGELDGTVTTLATGAERTVTDVVTTVGVIGGGASASCDILSLVLGPLDLNILGLDVELSQIVLDITAEPGPGNLLGNLLCAVAGLLDGGNTGVLANLLNRLLGL